jgi:4-hydroxy-3-methylbut-2-enyl diphosphate reductase
VTSEDDMEVLRAEVMGFCFGVRDAVAGALATDAPHEVTIHGELVHNESVQAALAAHGFAAVGEDARAATLPATPRVLVTAHGISERERARLRAAGKTLIDTTCPLVQKAHHAAQRLVADGRHLVVIGRAGHVEVRGLVEDAPSHDVIGSVAEARALGHARLGVVCQTTVPPDVAEAVLTALRACNPDADIRFADTICEPTRQRLAAVESLAPRVDAMVVVGGRTSNNTQKLVQLAAGLGARTVHVQDASELDPTFFKGCRRVGLTAGTSTPDAVIDAVAEALAGIDPSALNRAGLDTDDRT